MFAGGHAVRRTMHVGNRCTPGGTGVAFGRILMQDGIVARYLNDHCRAKNSSSPYRGPTAGDRRSIPWGKSTSNTVEGMNDEMGVPLGRFGSPRTGVATTGAAARPLMIRARSTHRTRTASIASATSGERDAAPSIVCHFWTALGPARSRSRLCGKSAKIYKFVASNPRPPIHTAMLCLRERLHRARYHIAHLAATVGRPTLWPFTGAARKQRRSRGRDLSRGVRRGNEHRCSEDRRAHAPVRTRGTSRTRGRRHQRAEPATLSGRRRHGDAAARGSSWTPDRAARARPPPGRNAVSVLEDERHECYRL